MKKSLKICLIALAAITAAAALTVCVSLIVLDRRTSALHDGYTRVYDDERYSAPVSAEGIDVFGQQVSCGYAVIEMFSQYAGERVTEQQLYGEYGRVVTSTGENFCAEMNKRFPRFDTSMWKYLPDSELVSAVYGSLSDGVPVPFEWAAKRDGEWTLHYLLVTGMDIPADRVTVANPYGYTEQITLGEFLDRTSFEAYADMPLFLKMGFAFGIFEKNTVYIPKVV